MICRRLAVESRKGCLLCGHGSSLELFDVEHCRKNAAHKLFDGEDIYKIRNASGGVFVIGHRSVAYVTDRRLFRNVTDDQSTSWIFIDQPIDIAPLDEENQVAILFGTSLIALYRYELPPFKMNLLKYVRSERFALITSCLLLGSSWNSLIVVAGTMDGELLVTVPSYGAATRAILECHQGMIFGIIRYNEFLYSVADDRSLAVWDASILMESYNAIDNVSHSSNGELDQGYGHSSRPYCLCSDADGYIYTGGCDEIVCVWSYVDDKLKMVYQKNIRAGAIRALHVMNRKLFVACESGALLSVPIEEFCENFMIQNYPPQNVLAFVRVRDAVYYVKENNSDGEKNVATILTRSPLYTTGPLIMAHVQEKSCHFFTDQNGYHHEALFDSVIVSVNICDIFALMYCLDRIGRLVDVTNRTLIAKLDFYPALDWQSVKSIVKISSIAVTSVGEKVFIAAGAVSGHLFYTQFVPFTSSTVPMDTSSEVNKHFGRKVINQLRARNSDIFALGANGVLVRFKICDDLLLHVMSVGLACPWLHGFTPCSFSTDGDLILGFHGNNFHVVDTRVRNSVGIVPCGGVHRHWSFSLQENYDVLLENEIRKRRGRFEFLRKGVIVCADIYLEPLLFIVPRFHRRNILDICALIDTAETSYVATVGADNMLQVAEIHPREFSWKVLVPLFNSFVTTCVYSFPSPDSLQILVGGEKGTVVMWIVVQPEAFMTDDSCDIQSISYKRSYSSARVTDIAITNGKFRKSYVSPCECSCAVAYGDGTIEFLTVSDHKGTDVPSFQKIFSFSMNIVNGYQSSDYSVFTKLVTWVADNSIYFYVASTSGKICIWKATSDCTPEFLSSIAAENCGLSTLTYEYSEDTNGILAVGADSGRITLFCVCEEDVEKLITVDYHATTVTGIALSVKQSNLDLISLAQDCVLAIHLVDIASNDVRCIRAISLDIRDPASLILTSYGAVVVGNGMQVIPLAEWSERASSSSTSHS